MENQKKKRTGIRKRRKREEGGQRLPSAAWRGSYTVEAAMVAAMTILVLAALIYASLYAHDRAVCQSLVCEAAVAGSNFATEKERSEAAGQVKKRITESRFLGIRSLSGNAAVGQKSVISSWSAEFPVPGLVMKYLADNSLSVRGTWISKIQDPTGTIRLIRSAGELITGGDD